MGDNAGTDRLRGGLRFSSRDVGIAVTAAALAALAAYLILAKTASSGDEPPIRVKNGSLKVEMLAKQNSNKWKKGTVATKWHLDKGDRQNAVYEVYVGVLPGVTCSGGTFASGQMVKVTFSDEAWITFDAGTKKTEITTSIAFAQQGDTILEHQASGGGFIRRIEVDGNLVCEFNNKDELGGLTLVD